MLHIDNLIFLFFFCIRVFIISLRALLSVNLSAVLPSFFFINLEFYLMIKSVI